MKKYTVFGIFCLVLLLSAANIYAQGFTGGNIEPQINSVRALQIAQTRFPAGASVIGIEWELKRGWSEWEVKAIRNGLRYTVKINGENGQIISYRERQYTPRQPIPQPPANRVSFETIRQSALSAFPGGVIVEIEWKYSHGRWIYEVELRQNGQNGQQGRKSKIHYDSTTGSQISRTWN